jgi:hypothetical protein
METSDLAWGKQTHLESRPPCSRYVCPVSWEYWLCPYPGYPCPYMGDPTPSLLSDYLRKESNEETE